MQINITNKELDQAVIDLVTSRLEEWVDYSHIEVKYHKDMRGDTRATAILARKRP